MTYKQIETSREIRLWIGQVVVPAALIAGAVMSNPEARRIVTEKASKVKRSIKNKFKREED